MSTLANPHTIAVVDLLLQGDPAISPQLRKRAVTLLTHGAEDPAIAGDLIGVSAFAAILGIHKSTISRWHNGCTTTLGPWPFSTTTDLKGNRRYSRAEAVTYLHAQHFAQTPRPPTPGATP